MSSPTLLNIPPFPLQIGGGINLRGSIIADCTKLAVPPASVTILANWATYGASSVKPVLIEVDLSIMASSNPLDAIRSIYIDNTFSPTTVYAYFQDTQFIVVCPPYSTCFSPVWTNGRKVQLYASDFDDLNIPKTTYQLSNVHINEYNAIAAVPTAPNKQVIPTTVNATLTGAPVFTFNNNDFGILSSKGIQFVSVHLLAATSITNVKFNGVNGTAVGPQANNATPIRTALYRAPSNLSGSTTVQIIVTSVAGLACAIQVFTTFNLTGGGAAANSISSNGGTAVVPLPTPTDGVAIAASTSNGTVQSANLAGIANNQIQSVGVISAIAYQKTLGTTLNISTPQGDASTAWIASSFV